LTGAAGPARGRRSLAADLSLLLIAAIWGTTFALLRDTLRFIHPVELMALRFSIGGAIVAAVYGRRFSGATPLWLWDGTRTGAFLAAGYLFQVIGLASITASRSAFLTSTYVPMTPFAAYLLLRTRPDWGGAAGVVLVSLGLLAFAAPSGPGRGGANALSLARGDLWTLGCAAAFAAQIVYTNVAARRSDFAVVTMVQLLLTAAVAWLLVLARGGFSVPMSRVPWAVILYLATFATAFVITLQTWALGRTTPIKAAVLFSTEPIFAAVFAGLFFRERMARLEVVGAVLILGGVLTTELWGPLGERLRRLRGRPRTVG
jgi:drug/metabolite transporter (DMT)-like permease